MTDNNTCLRFTVFAGNVRSEDLEETHSTDDEIEANWLAMKCHEEFSYVEILDREKPESKK